MIVYLRSFAASASCACAVVRHWRGGRESERAYLDHLVEHEERALQERDRRLVDEHRARPADAREHLAAQKLLRSVGLGGECVPARGLVCALLAAQSAQGRLEGQRRLGRPLLGGLAPVLTRDLEALDRLLDRCRLVVHDRLHALHVDERLHAADHLCERGVEDVGLVAVRHLQHDLLGNVRRVGPHRVLEPPRKLRPLRS